MRGRRTLRAGLVLAAMAVGLISAGCLPAGPPAPASLTVTPSQVNFPVSQANGFMPQLPITVTNIGGHTATSVVVHAVNVYSVPSSNCNVLGPGQSCTAMVQFCPGAQGQYNYSLVVTGQDATSGAPLTASTMLTGAAIP